VPIASLPAEKLGAAERGINSNAQLLRRKVVLFYPGVFHRFEACDRDTGLKTSSKTHMKLKHILFLVALTAATPSIHLGAAESKAPATAEGSKPAAKKAPKNTYPLYGKIVEASAKTLTIVRSDAPDAEKRQYALTPETEIVHGDTALTSDELKPGLWVGGLLKKSEGEGKDIVLRVNTGVKQRGGVKAAAEPKASDDAEAKPAKKKAKAKETAE
jgi:hypothetical protein